MITFIYFSWGGACAASKDKRSSQFSFSTLWVLEIKLRSLGLVANAAGRGLTLESRNSSWGGGSVGEEPAVGACRPELGPQQAVTAGCGIVLAPGSGLSGLSGVSVLYLFILCCEGVCVPLRTCKMVKRRSQFFTSTKWAPRTISVCQVSFPTQPFTSSLSHDSKN